MPPTCHQNPDVKNGLNGMMQNVISTIVHTHCCAAHVCSLIRTRFGGEYVEHLYPLIVAMEIYSCENHL